MSQLPSQILIAIFQLIISIFQFIFVVFSWYGTRRSQTRVIQSKEEEESLELSQRAITARNPVYGNQTDNLSSSSLPPSIPPSPPDTFSLPHHLDEGSSRP
ncbi:hypothetical protein F4801DRAFT_559474 [Xylaria longipes]|nr:hypothetical protein F4801DRAFT_559474 [Xylaria longipes]